MRLLSIGEAAELLDQLEPGMGEDYFLRQVRGFVQRGLIAPAGYRRGGRTAAALLGAKEVCAARMLSVLSRLGVQPGLFRAAVGCMRNYFPGSVLEPDAPAARGYGFPGASAAILAGEPLFLCLKVDLRPREPGDDLGGVSGGFHSERTLAGRGLSRQPTPVAVVLDCAQLFGPVLRRMAGPPDPGAPEPASAPLATEE